MSEQNRVALVEKWNPILEHAGSAPINSAYRKEVTAVLLENQERDLREQAHINQQGGLNEAAPTNSVSAGGMSTYDPVLISLVRRSMPQLIAYDIAGVQPMSQPTGLIFAQKSRYNGMKDTPPGTAKEALFNEADTAFSGTGTQTGTNPAVLAPAYTTGTGMTTAQAEALGSAGGNAWGEMGFSIDRVQVHAKTRALKAEYSIELAQDMKSVHGLDAENELVNILSSELLAEMNRELVRTVYITAKPGAQVGTATAGVFDLDVDSNGRWSVEKFKGLMFQVEREANAIAQQTRRGRGNFIICSSDVASALAMAGVLDYNPALSTSLNVDEASTTFAGVLNGKYKVYIDPYAANQAGTQFLTVGYKGANAYDAGLFYCPFVPLQMVRAVDSNTMQPKIGFKTRYDLVANPFVTLDGPTPSGNGIVADSNYYFRRVAVTNLM